MLFIAAITILAIIAFLGVFIMSKLSDFAGVQYDAQGNRIPAQAVQYDATGKRITP